MLAAALIACSLPTSTQSFKIELNAYRGFAYVERHQYPGLRKQFYPVKEERDVNGVHEIVLYNPEIYFEAERTLILRLGPKPTLEVFWIRGSTGFGAGGESGSEFYDCTL